MASNPFDKFDATSNPFDQFGPALSRQNSPGKGTEQSFTGSFSRGFKRALPETKSLLLGAGAAAAGAVGANDLRDAALTRFQRIQNEDVAPLQSNSSFLGVVRGDDSASEFAGDTLGNLAGQALESVAAAGAGALVGSSAPGAGTVAGGVAGLVGKTALKRGIAQKVGTLLAEKAATDVGRKQLARGAGALVGQTGLNIGQETGISFTDRAQDAEAAGQQLNQGDAFRAIAAGVPSGLVDSAAEGLAATRLLRGISGSPSLARRVTGGAGVGALTEGGTEGIQSVIERAGAGRDLTSEEAGVDFIENFAAGALGGSVLGAGGGLRRRQPSNAGADVQSQPPEETQANPTEQPAPTGQGQPSDSGFNTSDNAPDQDQALAPDATINTAPVVEPAQPVINTTPGSVEHAAAALPQAPAPIAPPVGGSTLEQASQSLPFQPLPETVAPEPQSSTQANPDGARQAIIQALDAGRAPSNKQLASIFGLAPEQVAAIRTEVQQSRRPAPATPPAELSQPAPGANLSGQQASLLPAAKAPESAPVGEPAAPLTSSATDEQDRRPVADAIPAKNTPKESHETASLQPVTQDRERDTTSVPVPQQELFNGQEAQSPPAKSRNPQLATVESVSGVQPAQAEPDLRTGQAGRAADAVLSQAATVAGPSAATPTATGIQTASTPVTVAELKAARAIADKGAFSKVFTTQKDGQFTKVFHGGKQIASVGGRVTRAELLKALDRNIADESARQPAGDQPAVRQTTAPGRDFFDSVPSTDSGTITNNGAPVMTFRVATKEAGGGVHVIDANDGLLSSFGKDILGAIKQIREEANDPADPVSSGRRKALLELADRLERGKLDPTTKQKPDADPNPISPDPARLPRVMQKVDAIKFLRREGGMTVKQAEAAFNAIDRKHLKPGRRLTADLLSAATAHKERPVGKPTESRQAAPGKTIFNAKSGEVVLGPGGESVFFVDQFATNSAAVKVAKTWNGGRVLPYIGISGKKYFAVVTPPPANDSAQPSSTTAGTPPVPPKEQRSESKQPEDSAGQQVPEQKAEPSKAAEEVRAEGLTATHADPGESPEPATPAVIAESAKTTPVKPETNVGTLAGQDALIEAVEDGKVTAAEFKAGFEALLANRAAITAELAKLTKDQLLQRHRGFNRPADKKGELVENAFRQMVVGYGALRDGALSILLAPSRDVVSSYIAAVRPFVESTTDEKLAEYAKKAAEARAAREQLREQAKAAVADPKTYDDFVTYIRAKQSEGLTFTEARATLSLEQRGQLDSFMAEKSREERRAKKTERKTEVRAAGQTVSGEVVATKHTKHGHDLYVVQLAERVSREDYETLNTSAKRLGGSYSSFRGNGAVPGFQFRTRDAAEAFRALAGGDTEAAREVAKARRDAFDDDRSQSAVERLREMADKLDDRASDSLGRERKANTERRARFAANAEAVANADKALASTMRNIAMAIEGDTAKLLDQVRTKSQVELLAGEVRRAQGDELRANYPSYSDQEKHRGEPPTAATVEHATWPVYTLFRSDWATLGRQLLNTMGSKLIGQKILKMADDVSKEYLAFAKVPSNLIQLTRFQVQGSGERPTYRSLDDAEGAILRSGYRGKAIPYKVKNGEYTIIISPSVARERGLWKGDDDKRITVNPEIGAEVVEKIGRANRKASRRDRIDLPWQLESAHDRRAALARLGIETPAEFRVALREFIALREAPAAEDEVKKLERAMVGRKNDGFDFFPTSPAVVADMLAAAEIEPGMSVLEPSAGMGHIADAIRETGVEPEVGEIATDRRELLEAKGYTVVSRDFLDQTSEAGGYDRIVMNPPFSNRRDAEHVRHAYGLLKPGGRLVAIMGEGVFFGQDQKAKDFRAWLDQVGGTDEKLPDGSFMDPSLPVNTAVAARMVVIDRPEGVPTFSLPADNLNPSGKGQPQTARQVREVIASITAKWKGGPTVRVVDDADGLPDYAKADHDHTTAEGLYDPDTGTVYLVAPKLRNPNHARRVLVHEAVGHFGIERITGAQQWAQIAEVVSKMANNPKHADLFNELERRGYKSTAPEFVKEAVAVMAERGVRNSIIDRVITSLRRFLRSIGVDLQMTDRELRQHIVRAARGLEQGNDRGMLGSSAVPSTQPGPSLFSKDLPSPAQTAAFVLRAMAKMDGFFQYPKSDKKTLRDVVSEVTRDTMTAKLIGSAKVNFTEDLNERIDATKYEITTPSGAKLDVYEEYRGNRLYLDASSADPGASRGSAVYAALFQYALNTGKVFIGDPNGLSIEALLRRTEHMLSAALKHGTTRMMAPHPRQVEPLQGQWDGGPQKWAHPLAWADGKDADNIAALIETSYNNHAGFFKGTASETAVYNFRLGRVEDAGGQPVSDGRLERDAQQAGAAFRGYRQPPGVEQPAAAIGRASGARFVLVQSLIRAAQGPGRSAALAAIAEKLATGSLDPALQRKFYSQPDPVTGNTAADAIFAAVDAVASGPAPTLLERTKARWKDLSLKNLKDGTRKEWLGVFTLDHLSDLADDIKLPFIRDYANIVQTMQTDRTLQLQKTGDLSSEWQEAQRVNQAGANRMSQVMHAATLAGVDPDAAFVPGTFVREVQQPNDSGAETTSREEVAITAESVQSEIARLRRESRGKDDATKAKAKQRIESLESALANENKRLAAYPELVRRFGELAKGPTAFQVMRDGKVESVHATETKANKAAAGLGDGATVVPAPQLQALYRGARDALDRQSREMEQALVDRIESLTEEGKTRAAFVAQIRQQFELARKQGPYFPLSRWGNYWISATNANGEPAFFMYEKISDWRRQQKELPNHGYTINKAGIRSDGQSSRGTIPGGFIADIDAVLGKAGVDDKTRDTVHQLFLRTLPDASLRKHFIHRKGTQGFSNDALRAFSHTAFHGAHQIARLRHAHQLDATLTNFERVIKGTFDRSGNEVTAGLVKSDPERGLRAQTLLNELALRNEYVQNPKDSVLANHATALGFTWYLGMTPAAAIINLTQNYLITLPHLAADHGWTRAFAMINGGMSHAVKNSHRDDRLTGLSADEQRAITQWNNDGTIELTNAHSLAGLSEADTTGFNPGFDKAMRMVSFLFHKAEVINREGSGLAAYRLARQGNPATGAAPMTHDQAVAYASRIIKDTHFNYSAANRARWMQGDWKKVLLMFRQYSLNTTYVLWRNFYKGYWADANPGGDAAQAFTKEQRLQGRKTLNGILGMSFLMSGALGLPLASVGFGVANALAAAFGDEDDEPFDADIEFRNFLADYLGTDVARIITDGPLEGIPRLLGIATPEIGSRVGLNELWLRDADRELEGRDAYFQMLETIAGPMGGLVKGVAFTGPQLIRDGQLLRGVEQMMPKQAKDMLKALRFASQGVQTLNGDPIIEDVSLPQTLLQLAGFSPAELNERYDANSAVKGFEQKLQARRSNLLASYALAWRAGDAEDMQTALAKIARWNAANPTWPINSQTIRTSLRARIAASERMVDGIVVNRRIEAQARAQGRFAE